MAFAFSRLAVVVDDGAVDVDAGTGVEAVGYHARGGAGGAFVAIVAVAVGVGGYDEHDFAVLFEVFILAGAVVVVEGFAFVEELDAAVVVGFGFAGGESTHFADLQTAFGYVEGVEVEGIGDAFVSEDEGVRSEVWLDSAGTVGGVGWWETIAVVAVSA